MQVSVIFVYELKMSGRHFILGGEVCHRVIMSLLEYSVIHTHTLYHSPIVSFSIIHIIIQLHTNNFIWPVTRWRASFTSFLNSVTLTFTHAHKKWELLARAVVFHWLRIYILLCANNIFTGSSLNALSSRVRTHVYPWHLVASVTFGTFWCETVEDELSSGGFSPPLVSANENWETLLTSHSECQQGIPSIMLYRKFYILF